MRVRVPPQLLVFAVAAAIAMTIPGLPSRYPPPIEDGLAFSWGSSASGEGWSERVRSRFPRGSSIETLVRDLNQQHFNVAQHEDLGEGGLLTYASIAWPSPEEEGCYWMLAVTAKSDPAGLIVYTDDEVRISCGGVL